jgi:methyl-accepting chemotaxis protein
MTTANQEVYGQMIARLAIATEKLLDGMQDLKSVSVNQAQSLERLLSIATRQQESIQQFVTVLGEQATAITELSRSLRDSVESTRQLARTVDAAAVMARANQDSLRSLLEELRQTRLN